MNLRTGEKIIAIHQPNYIPWQGFFYKMMKSDTFVFLDNVQYSKNSIINRNKIKTANGEMWLTIPVLTKNAFRQAINEVKINNTADWSRKHLNAITQNYAKSQFFRDYQDKLTEIYTQRWDKLVDINKVFIKFIADCLDIKREFVTASGLGVSGESTDLLIGICKKLNADTYLSGRGGKKYLDEEKFEAAGIKIEYTNFKQPQYEQLYGDFMPNLSTLDLLFNKGADSRRILEGA